MLLFFDTETSGLVDFKLSADHAQQPQGMTQNKTPNLGEAVQIILGREHTGAHRALDDVRATAQIYFVLRGDPVFVAAGQDFKTNAARQQPVMTAPAMKPPARAISPIEPETMF